MLEAAERLFGADGYAATSMAAIAREAGVAPRTVYVAFETKSGLLRALWNLRLRGDEAPQPVGERPWYRAVLDEPDPERKLRRNAENLVAVRRRIGAVLAVIRDAASVDPEVGSLWARMQSDFHENQKAIVDSLAAAGALRDGLSAEAAADILWTINNPTVYLLMVRDRGWSLEDQAAWAGETACAQLLQPSAR